MVLKRGDHVAQSGEIVDANRKPVFAKESFLFRQSDGLVADPGMKPSRISGDDSRQEPASAHTVASNAAALRLRFRRAGRFVLEKENCLCITMIQSMPSRIASQRRGV